MLRFFMFTFQKYLTRYAALLILGLFVITIGCSGKVASTYPSGTLLYDIDILLARKGISFHKTLRDIQAVAKKYRLSKGFSELENYLKSHGFSVHKTEEKIECVIKKDAYICLLGDRYDLSLTFWKSFYPLGFARAGFQTSRGIAYSDFLGKKNFTLVQKKRLIDPVISKVFLHPLISQASDKYPLVKELKVEYGLLFERRCDSSPYAFLVDISFGGNAKNPKAYKSYYLSIMSCLDYPLRYDGTEITNAYPRRDILREVRMHSSSEGH
jgi:hypothetical protein